MKQSKIKYDYIIIGSGFGGSVSAMRLAQKGYKVAVIESGKRYRAEDYCKTNWNIRKFLWLPKIFCYGIWRFHFLSKIAILAGAGVGGGSLNYANTLYIPPKNFFKKKTIKQIGGEKILMPFYKLAQKMLGVVENPLDTEADRIFRETAAEFGREHTFNYTPVGVFFGKEGKKYKDPYFMGEGPDRIGCDFCGACMNGCPNDAKNTLDKNYLYFAEKFGVTIIPESKVIEVKPLSHDGSDGYEVKTKKTTGLFGIPRTIYRSKGVIFSAGVLGTIPLLFKMKDKNILPNLSDRLGKTVRTNNESLICVRSKNKDTDLSKGIAITSSVHPDEVTHIEPTRFSKGSDAMGLLATVLTDGGGKIPRQLRYLGNIIRHPLQFLRWCNPIGFAQKSIFLLVMQTVDNSITLSFKRQILWPFKKILGSIEDKNNKIPTYIPIANEFARRLAKRINGMPGSTTTEVLFDIPATAHILGGSIISKTPEEGVIDPENRVFGYKNMLVCDGSMMPVNLGVNPSLTIVTLTERAMSFIPPKDSKKVKTLKAEKKWKVIKLLNPARSKKKK